nr:structural maintenance of chromosomes protein 6 [Zootoca vivipara]XP_034965921.1 structural maintenance of chromosomes protein 6 [Zootoca vivipara]XP_034965922.1 structural maintenance of chromosomes protein 6 [Zootoca vivipara]XP_034965923.1 structural maintenance of chromosomes protein 6 [Zootoca vivipara]XP_034965924.1 structural maintenance of chromosomes protein 6 [Zootoca vivipara]XP_034965925.1 structural maintenance of chromosomes protein 6 [Zootoca vivipara]
MSKRKERSFSTSSSEKRPRQATLDSDDDPNEEELSQLQSDSGYYSQSVSGEVGIIESIQLKNFMCHSMLGPFKFGPNVNFIVGNNGSGKSAVLTALMVGLGGKATVTNRGTSLKVFVKDGQSSADVSITLRNRGEDAFKPQQYGDSITINQRINLEGHRNYKLKSSTGAIISSKKEELTAILDHFNIQVDNPVSILTQEMSKQFLQSKNEGDKYKFFMKATQLEQMKQDYAYIMETKARTHDQIEQGAKFLEELRERYLEKEDRYKSIAFVSEMQNELKKLQHQIAWAMVRDTEKEVKTLRDDVGALEARTGKFVEKVKEWQTKVKDAEGKHRTMQDKLEKITEEAQALEPSCAALKADIVSKRRAKNDAEAAYNRSQNELKRLAKDHEQLCKKIEELKTSAEQISEPETLAKQARIERAAKEEQLRTLRDQEESNDNQIKQFQEAIKTYKEEAARLKKEELELKQILDSQQRQLKELKESKTNQLKRFGHYMPDLCEAVERAHQQGQFKYKPLGPIGAFIHLKDPDFALAIETCLKGLIWAFCCDNHKDERTLQVLMSRFCQPGLRPQIIVSSFQNKVYDVSQRTVVHPEFPTVLAALDIDNAVISNCLIDMRRIETVLLIKNNEEARRIMHRNNLPKNCKEAFTGDGDQVLPRQYYSCENKRPRILSKDVEADISHLEKEVGNKKTHLSVFQQRIRSTENSIRENEHFLKTHRLDQEQLKIKVKKIKLAIMDLENVEEQQSDIISTLEEEAQDNKRKMETVEEHMRQQKKKMEDEKCILKEAEQKLEVIRNKIHQVEEEAGPVRDGLHEVDEELEQSKSHLQHYEEKEKSHLGTIKTHKNNLATREKELMEMIAKASEIHPERIEVNRTYKSLDTEINRLREKINSERKRTGDREEIIRELQEAKEKYQTAGSEVKNLKKFIKLLDEMMVERYKTYQRFRRLVTVRCKYYFNCLLSQRSYSGKIEFDHKNEKLSITVQPGEGNKAALDDMKSLSGGERSFSTVCFILSLWSIAESPFRCLDEFDVFMDMVNRRIAMDMMLKMADSQRYRQFVLLTPQNMSTLPTSRLIRILRMQDPERGQNKLTFRHRGDEDEDEE